MFGRRSVILARSGMRHASSGHHGNHHAPVKNIDLNIALEGVETRWVSLVTEQKDVVVKQAQDLMKSDWKKLTIAQKNTRNHHSAPPLPPHPRKEGKHPPSQDPKDWNTLLLLLLLVVLQCTMWHSGRMGIQRVTASRSWAALVSSSSPPSPSLLLFAVSVWTFFTFASMPHLLPSHVFIPFFSSSPAPQHYDQGVEAG